MDGERDLTPALQQAGQRRKTLHDSLVHLEEALSSPAAGRIEDWTAVVAKEMHEVGAAFEQHIVVTEQPDGLYDEILERAPRLAGNVRRLREEHPEITAGIAKMIAKLDDTTDRSRLVAVGTGARRPPTLHRLGDPPPPARRGPRLGGLQRRHRRARVAPPARLSVWSGSRSAS